MITILTWFIITIQAIILQDGSKQDILELNTEQIGLNGDGLFRWRHFDLELTSSCESLIDTIMLNPSQLEILIYDSKNEEVKRKKTLDRKIYPDPEKASPFFESSGEIELKRTGTHEFSVKIQRKFKSRSSNHKSISEYDIEEGSYSLLVQYRLLDEREILKTKSIPLVIN